MLAEKKCDLPEVASNVHGHRKEVDKIVEALKGKTSKTAAGVLVSGVAGVGKSTVAVQAGHRLKNEFKDIVKFCSLRGAYKGGSEDDGVLKKIQNVCVPVHRQSSEYPKHDLLDWCRRLDYELVLIIDNAEDAIGDRGDYTFVNLLSEMSLRSADKIQFVVNSRRSDIETVETIQNIQFVKIALDPLDVEESIEVLKNGANLTSDIDADTKGELREIAELCENIPLVLRLAGPLLAKESECTFEELKKNLDKNATRALDVKPMMQIAFEKLDESFQCALVSLSVFPKSFKRDAALAILGDDRAEALTNLTKRCLIQKQDDRYLIHLLIRDYAKKEIGKRDEFRQIRSEGKQGFLKHFLSLVLKNAKKYWGKDSCKESLVLFSEERINLEYTLRKIARDLKKFETCSEVESLINEIQQAAPYIEYCVHFKLYHEFLTGLHDQLCQSQEKITKQAEILCLLYHASRKQSGQNKDNSEKFILKAKELRDKNASKFKLDRLSEAFYLSYYGRYLSQDRNERKQAQPLLMQSKSIYEEETPKSDSTFDQGRILVQMGHNAKKEKIIREQALEYYREAICFRSKYYGRHFLTAFAHKDLADYYLSINDFIEAEKSYMEAIKVLENMEMTEQKEAVPVYKNFGWCCEKRDKIDQARKELENGRDVADNTIEGSFKWKVEINTYLALLLYKHYSEDKSTAHKLSNDVFNMSKELDMDKWSGKNELEQEVESLANIKLF